MINWNIDRIRDSDLVMKWIVSWGFRIIRILRIRRLQWFIKTNR